MRIVKQKTLHTVENLRIEEDLSFRGFKFCFTWNSPKIRRFYFAFIYKGTWSVGRNFISLDIVWSPFYKCYI
ncbi:hypothetical protein UABAM_02902 [Candidatus Uabimicrobium amorphum]|uniref:Uncharacterized protein n=1 Tax=Uabimicrobium amorphum TaxID=2596890 RepID=A0A5S9F3R8_UABAM|nr:hypothetical protein UABAM_02902 [Candidatus Uabimicrobium amorphum]